MYSLWLKPSVESFRRYQTIISNLAIAYKTPNFQPHITLKAGIDNIDDSMFYKIAVLAALTNVFDIKSTSLSIQNSYYQSLYAAIHNNAMLESLCQEVQILFPNNKYDFQPHISLMYANISKIKKLKIIQENRKNYPKLIGLEGIQVMKTKGKPAEWEMIEYFPFQDEGL